MILQVRIADKRTVQVEVPDNCPSQQAAMMVARALNYGPVKAAWRLGTALDEHDGHVDVLYLHLSQTVGELANPQVFLVIEPEGVARWN